MHSADQVKAQAFRSFTEGLGVREKTADAEDALPMSLRRRAMIIAPLIGGYYGLNTHWKSQPNKKTGFSEFETDLATDKLRAQMLGEEKNFTTREKVVAMAKAHPVAAGILMGLGTAALGASTPYLHQHGGKLGKDLFAKAEAWQLKRQKAKMGSAEEKSQAEPPQIEPAKVKRKKFPFQGYIEVCGLKIDIENKRGSTRRGTGTDGKPWATYMHHHYGEIRGTEGADGDKLDVYVGPNIQSGLVVIVHQQDPKTQKYDEDKVMLGFNDEKSAVAAYKKQYNRPGFYQSHTTMPMDRFCGWCSDRKNHGKKVAHLLCKMGGLRQAAQARFRSVLAKSGIASPKLSGNMPKVVSAL